MEIDYFVLEVQPAFHLVVGGHLVLDDRGQTVVLLVGVQFALKGLSDPGYPVLEHPHKLLNHWFQ